MNKEIYITEFDLERLRTVIADEKAARGTKKHLQSLEEELERAVLVNSEDVPADVVTMNSRVRLKEMDADEEMVFQLVFPQDADAGRGRISILAPVGTAVIGFRVGDVIDWEVPSGSVRFRIEEVLYQPEASGDFNL